MDPDADLASVAALMADKHRAQMLLTLLGGTPMSGSALAEAAGISRSLASAHLKKLVAGGLVRAQPSGRQQLYSIASEPVADALEVLILLAPATKVRSLGDASRARSTPSQSRRPASPASVTATMRLASLVVIQRRSIMLRVRAAPRLPARW